MQLSIGEIIGIATGLIAIISFIFIWGWRVIMSVKDSAHTRIDRVGARITDLEHNHSDFEKDVINRLEEIKNNISGKADRENMFKYMDATFVRKDVHCVEYSALTTKMNEIDEKLEKVLRNGQQT